MSVNRTLVFNLIWKTLYDVLNLIVRIQNQRDETRKYVVRVRFATHAIHIELIADLTDRSFLNALKRFTSKPGYVSLQNS